MGDKRNIYTALVGTHEERDGLEDLDIYLEQY
jgi:hypothetical protein